MRKLTSNAFQLDIAPGRVHHVRGVTGSAAALFARALRERTPLEVPVVLVTKDADSSGLLVDDLRAFDSNSRIVWLQAQDRTPYDGLRPDRAVALNRASALFELDSKRAPYFVTSAVGWIRRCPPPRTLEAGALALSPGAHFSLVDAAQSLTAGGYTRVPLVEDPGSFAVRGDILDVWPPSLPAPLRIEVDFDKLVRVRPYNPETQVTGETPDEGSDPEVTFIPPARETILSDEARTRAREVLRNLCDAVSHPSKKARHLIEEVVSGRMFLGSDAYLPALAELEPLSQRIDPLAPLVFVEPDRICEAVEDDLERAQEAYASAKDEPHFPPDAHYVTRDLLEETTRGRTRVCLHDLAISGGNEGGFFAIREAPDDTPHAGLRDQSELTARLQSTRQAEGRHAGLAPLVAQVRTWLDDGASVVISARGDTQADRLATLLEHRAFTVDRSDPDYFRPAPARLHVTSSPLSRGLQAPDASLYLLTEEEIFGRRAHRSRQKASTQLSSALDDLRSLSDGDLVVHIEHGIGRYRGLSHHKVGENVVELLVVEYQAGDKLLLPVYRLNQIQKLSGEATAKLDRLGGQTFAKAKSKVRKRVRIMADQLLKLYAERRAVRRAPLDPPGDEYATFAASFPYEETPDQAAAICDVIADLGKETVMDRLVCGDVGFGKTEVALRAAFLCALCGRQVALLCPTTVLAEQHLRTFERRLGDSGIRVEGLSRFQSKRHHSQTLADLKAGKVDVVIGTHRLLSKDVHFKNLGLLIIDEEQRFGVAHKERLKELRRTVDVLTLSATPIPRTLNLAVSGLRDISVIATPPLERRAIRTLTSRFDEQVVARAIENEIGRGGQVYYVHNRVEGIYERAALLSRIVPHARVAVAHGQMTERSLEKTMLSFVSGEFDVLCATSIVESGLDIPSANTIIIDRADMFGLSQLYQIRGRVGRSAERAYCYLLVPPEERLTSEARARIAALEQFTELGSGFHIATMDMELRGAGELLGADQSGFLASVGFELFSRMLEEATAELRDEPYIADVDPELSIDVEAFLPETYVEDIGVRLSLYKRYALAEDESQVERINEELEDRFGRPPEQARRFAAVMRLKTELRRLRALGLSATGQTATLHLRDDTPLSPERLVPFVAESKGLYTLSPDGRLTRRLGKEGAEQNGLTHADQMLDELASLLA